MLQGFPQGERVARISGNEGMQQWPFWLDVEVTALKPLLWMYTQKDHGWVSLVRQQYNASKAPHVLQHCLNLQMYDMKRES